jgi:hypothetical protein
MKSKAILVGPFVGELHWEFFHFAPHVIHLKKNNPGVKIIVLTRISRFDLYGQYADIVVPLRLKNDKELQRNAYKLMGYDEENYYSIAKYFKEKFKKKYKIIKHVYPDISLWRYKVKWQFHRNEMNYEFKPREKNIDIARRVMGRNNAINDDLSTETHLLLDGVIPSFDLFARITNFVNDVDNSTLGSLIESIRLCDFVVGDIKFEISHLALLLGIPLIHVGKEVSEDYIKLLNPLNTPIIISDNIENGVQIYEDNF